MTTPFDRLATALGRSYRVERELGQGGMATVYLAEDLKHERRVAIKVLHPELSAVIGAARFLAEIKLTAQLQHPHILGLIDSGECDGLLYYVMPFVEGETLRGRLTRETQLPVKDAVRLATEVASALEYAHKRGVIHRDVKPENVLLQDGRALVADFGIALAVQQAGGQRMTQTGLSLGTPSYMSPEQAMGEKSVDARADVYALGAMTYEMLQGDPPFTGSSSQAVIAQLLTARPRPLRELRPNVPVHVEHAVLTALEKLPADRQSSAAEFAQQLAAETLASTDATRVLTAQRPAATSGPAGGARRLLPLGLALLGAGAALGWGIGRPGRAGTIAVSGQPTVTSILAPPGGTFAERRSLALSPDGRTLAFVLAAGDGTRSLWLRHLDRLEAEPLGNTAGADMPFWSPDRRSLGFFADGYLTVRDPNGESRRLCQLQMPTGGSWGAKDVIVFGSRGSIAAVPAAGGECREVVRDSTGAMLRPAFLPDGQRFLYSRGRFLDVAIGDLDGRMLGTVPLRSFDVLVAPPDWVVVQGSDVFSAVAQRLDLGSLRLIGTAQRLTSFVRSSGGVPTVTVASDAFAYLPASPDRPYLEYGADGLLRDTVRLDRTWRVSARRHGAGAAQLVLAGGSGLWLYDLDADRATRIAPRDSAWARQQSPVFDPTGTKVVYTSPGRTPGAACAMLERDLATDAERVIARDSTFLSVCTQAVDWSPDGRRLLVNADSTLHLVTLDGSAPDVPIVRPGRLWEGRFSPDGRLLAFSSSETGRAEIYVQPLAGGQVTRVSQEGGRWPHWTRGGRTLVFLTPDGRVQEADVSGGSEPAVGAPRTRFSVPTWRRSMFDDAGTGFVVVGDGARYILRQSPSALGVALVQHWPALLRRGDSSTVAR